jgi:hypothetical protein
MRAISCLLAAGLLCGAALSTASANAAEVVQLINANLQNSPYTISFDGGGFTFSSTGDSTSPLAVQTSGGGEVSEVFGQPSSYFINRGTVEFGPDQFVQFAPFPTTTTVPFSNSDNFIGLESIENGQDYFGFAYTTDSTLRGFGYETVADQSITASAVPEPSVWAMMFAGVALMGAALRFGGKKRGVAALTA